MTLPRFARHVLLSHDPIARVAARATKSYEHRWMLAQPRDVRSSYVAHVVECGEDPNAEERWMLAQDDATRLSYVEEVLVHDPGAPPERAWMLKQSRRVRQSYVREVLDA